MDLFKKIFSRDEFAAHPPVLLDIGAAGHVHRKWKDIARHTEISAEGFRRFHDPIFGELENHAISRLQRGCFKAPLFVFKQFASKIHSVIQGSR